MTEIEKLTKKVEELENEIDRLKGIKAKVGDRVVVKGLSSWEGWQGELVMIDEENGKGHVRIYRSKSNRFEDCPTDLFRIEKAPAPISK